MVDLTGIIKMVVFDLDGVLVDVDSSWQTIHRAFGVNNEKNYQRYIRGEIDYKAFMRSDISLWGRTCIHRIKTVLDQVPLIIGAQETLHYLRRHGVKTAIISSGISLLAERVKEELGIDYAFANRLRIDKRGHLSGEGEEIVPLNNKGLILQELSIKAGIRLEESAAVGDSRFDIPLFQKAGLSIAFNTKDSVVRNSADVTIDNKDLRRILPWIVSDKDAMAEVVLDYNKREIAETIVKSILPDNVPAPQGLVIKSIKDENKVKTNIFCVKGIGTLLATLDDLLFNIQLAEHTLKTIETIT
jgi:phosphoserine phosphatase